MAPVGERQVFIVYGRNRRAHAAVVQFLRAVYAEPIDFEHVRARLGGTPFVGDVVREGLRSATVVLVLLTPDEIAFLDPRHRLRQERMRGRWLARPNVFMEAGIALGIDEQRTVLATIGHIELPSDLSGMHCVELGNSMQARQRLRDALIASGCVLPPPDQRWHEPTFAGDFDAAVKSSFFSRLRPLKTVILLTALVSIAACGVAFLATGSLRRTDGPNVPDAEITRWLNEADESRRSGRYEEANQLLDRVASSQPGKALLDYVVTVRKRNEDAWKAERGN